MREREEPLEREGGRNRFALCLRERERQAKRERESGRRAKSV